MESATQLDLLKERIEYDENIFTDNETYEKVLNRLLPTTLPIANSGLFSIDEITETTNSGIEVPIATTVRPIISSETPHRRARSLAPLVSESAPKRINTMPKTSNKMSSNILICH